MSSRGQFQFILLVLALALFAGETGAVANAAMNGASDDAVYIATFFPRPSPFSHSRASNRLSRARRVRKIEALNKHNYQVFFKKIVPVIEMIRDMRHHPERYRQVLIFWQLGEQLFLEKRNHGDNRVYHAYLTQTLASDAGIEINRLRMIERLYERYRVAAALSLKLTWEHYKLLLRVEDNRKRQYLMNLAVEKKWTPDELKNAIGND